MAEALVDASNDLREARRQGCGWCGGYRFELAKRRTFPAHPLELYLFVLYRNFHIEWIHYVSLQSSPGHLCSRPAPSSDREMPKTG